MSKNRFEGFYFKHQKNNNTLALIPGFSNNTSFIQVINNKASFYFSYPRDYYKTRDYRNGKSIKIGGCLFSKEGIVIDIQRGNTSITGRISYTGLTPLSNDIMGPFKYFPMECRHGIISLNHHLSGQMSINGQTVNFSGGKGYIEKDSGTSFPKSYLWLQCNDFSETCSVSVSVADIPFAGFNFTGCICAVYYNNKEYRLATYLGVKIVRCDNKKIVLNQRQYCLDIDISGCDGQQLLAPVKGKMNRIITETIACGARFRFFINGKLLFDFKSTGVSFEYAGH